MAAFVSNAGGRLKVAMCQFLVGSDKCANLVTARSAVNEAASMGAQLIALPECFNSPYSTAHFRESAETIPKSSGEVDANKHPSTAMLISAAKENNVYLIGGSIPENDNDKIYNTSIIVSPEGKLLGKHRKIHLFDIDVPGGIKFSESDTLSPGNSVTTFDTPFCKIGVGICYDIRFPQLAMLMRDAGCKLLVYPGAFNTTTGPLHWELLQRSRALDNQVFVATVSPARNIESDYKAWGHSSIVDPWGKVIATTEHGSDVVYSEIDLAEVDHVRQSIPISNQCRYDIYTPVTLVSK